MSEQTVNDSDLDLAATSGQTTAASDAAARRTSLLIGLGLAVLILAAGFAVPYVLPSRYYMALAVDAVILSILALSIGFLAKHLGLISLGHAGFYGGSAYALGIAIGRFEMGPTSAFIFAIATGTLLAVGMGLLVVRATGMGFLMLTLALGQAAYQLSTQRVARDWTGAYDGLHISIPADQTFLGLERAELMNAAYFWPIAWVALVLCFVGLWLVGRSRFGVILEGIRENEERMRFSGYGTYLPRLVAFVISGFVASVAGALFAMNASYVSPETLGFLKAGDALIAAIVGGLGVLFGPIFGAFLYIIAQANLNVGGNLHFYTGLLLVLVLVFLPGGILGSIVKQVRTRRQRGQGAEAVESTPESAESPEGSTPEDVR